MVLACAIVGLGLVKLNTKPVVLAKGSLTGAPDLEGDVFRLSGGGTCGARFVACAWYSTFLWGGISCLFAAVFLPVGRVAGDACFALHDFPLKVSNAEPSSSSSSSSASASASNTTDVLAGCWEDKSIFTILGLDDALTFDNINWGPLDDMEEVNLDNAAFHKLEEEIEDLDDSCPTKDECQDAMEKIKRSRADCETAIEDYQHNLQTVKSDQVEMLSVSSAAIKDAGSCGFLKTTFQETYAILCTDAVGAVSMMGACCLLLGCFGLGMGLALVLLQRRLGGHGPTRAPLGSGSQNLDPPPLRTAVVPVDGSAETPVAFATVSTEPKPYATVRPGDGPVNATVSEYSI